MLYSLVSRGTVFLTGNSMAEWSSLNALIQAAMLSMVLWGSDILVDFCFQLGSEGKRLRPTILLLMASSLSAAAAPPPELLAVDLRPPATHITEHRRRQQRVAEVMLAAWLSRAADRCNISKTTASYEISCVPLQRCGVICCILADSFRLSGWGCG